MQNNTTDRRRALKCLAASTAIAGSMAVMVTPARAEDKDLLSDLFKRFISFTAKLIEREESNEPSPVGSLGIRA